MADNGTWTQYQKLVLKLLEQHDEKLEVLIDQIRDADADRAVIHVSINSLKEDIEVLKSVVKDHENKPGHPATLIRIEKLETDVQNLKTYNQELIGESKELKKYKRGIITACIATALTVVWDLIQHFLL